jgi:ferritin-like protein
MAASSATLHEDPEQLRKETIDRHRAIASVMEELEAVDWYDQRVDASTDPELRAILQHNRDEEKEHAAMVLEWLRRRDPQLSDHLKTYLFTDRPVLEIEEEVEEGGPGEASTGGAPVRRAPSDGSLGIGSLRVGGGRG